MKAIFTILVESNNENDCNEIIDFKNKLESEELKIELEGSSKIKVNIICNIIDDKYNESKNKIRRSK